MKKQFLLTLLVFLGPLSITTVFGQTKGNLPPSIVIKDFFNYESLDFVFDKLISKYGLKINYKKDEVKGFNLTYAFSGTASFGRSASFSENKCQNTIV